MSAGLGRQAKPLDEKQISTLLSFVKGTNYPERNTVVVLLSFYAGFRAKDVACVTWRMVTDAEGNIGNAVALENVASKGKSGRVIAFTKPLRDALIDLHAHEAKKGRVTDNGYVITLRKGSTDPVMRAQSVKFLFRDWYSRLGFKGASSHSGRRFFITHIARNIGAVGGSMRDVQSLSGHKQLSSVMRYVETDPEAQRKVIARL